MLKNIFEKIRATVLDFIFSESRRITELETKTPEEIILEIPRAAFSGKNILAAFDYKHPDMRKMIWAVKYRGNQKIARLLAEALREALLEDFSDIGIFFNFKKPLLVPVPLSAERLRERGFSQTVLLAEKFAEACERDFDFTLAPELLEKTKNTLPQTKMKSGRARQHNLRGCFSVPFPEKIAGKNIILLDDVTTTGATFAEASRTLRASGAKKIICIAVAH